jgi:hypothetical protein
MELESALAIVLTAIGLFGWSHSALKRRMDVIEMQLNRKLEMDDVRLTIEDKLAPYKVEYESLSRRLDEIREDQQQLNKNVEHLIRMCAKLTRE